MSDYYHAHLYFKKKDDKKFYDKMIEELKAHLCQSNSKIALEAIKCFHRKNIKNDPKT